MTFPLVDARRAQYLQRLGFDRSPPLDAEGLRALHRAHLGAFPFENLDIHLGRPILLDGDAILAKLLDQGRGGYCYELNGAFGSLLVAVGFDVTLLEARVYGGAAGDEVGIHFDHACLLVDLGDGRRLADVGFGACFADPIEFRPAVDQLDPNGVYRLDERPDGWFDLLEDGQPRYRLSTTPRRLADFAPGNEHQQTSPDSSFTRNTVCSLATERGRVTLRGRQLIETVDGERTERELTADRLGSILAERFGIVLPAADLASLAAAD